MEPFVEINYHSRKLCSEILNSYFIFLDNFCSYAIFGSAALLHMLWIKCTTYHHLALVISSCIIHMLIILISCFLRRINHDAIKGLPKWHRRDEENNEMVLMKKCRLMTIWLSIASTQTPFTRNGRKRVKIIINWTFWFVKTISSLFYSVVR